LAEEERNAGRHRLIGEAEHEVGDRVEITGGVFAAHTATVTGVDDLAGRMLAEVELFGRMTPIELSFDDAAKAA
jgi:transcriptional antiterminator NusG